MPVRLMFELFLQKFGYKSYSRYVSDTLHYNQGIVVEISNENIEYDEGLKLYLGTQDLKVKIPPDQFAEPGGGTRVAVQHQPSYTESQQHVCNGRDST